MDGLMFRTALYEALRRCPARWRPAPLRIALMDGAAVVGGYEAQSRAAAAPPLALTIALPPGWQWLKQADVNRLVWHAFVAAMGWD